MYVVTVSLKRNRTGCDSASGYLRKAVPCRKDFSLRSGQVGVWIEKNERSDRTVRPFCLCPFRIHLADERFGCLWSVCGVRGARSPCLWQRAAGRASLPGKAGLEEKGIAREGWALCRPLLRVEYLKFRLKVVNWRAEDQGPEWEWDCTTGEGSRAGTAGWRSQVGARRLVQGQEGKNFCFVGVSWEAVTTRCYF